MRAKPSVRAKGLASQYRRPNHVIRFKARRGRLRESRDDPKWGSFVTFVPFVRKSHHMTWLSLQEGG